MATTVLNRRAALISLGALLAFSTYANAQSFATPGDLRLRHDLQLLNDTGAINIPLTAWPLSQRDVEHALAAVDVARLSVAGHLALDRVKSDFTTESARRIPNVSFSLSGAIEPRVLRGFETTPRDEGSAGMRVAWHTDRVAINLSVAYQANPFDDDAFRPDGTYVSLALGNWLLSGGWQDRWFGPGRDGSLILSTNARPAPGLMLQRATSKPFETRWLRWLGPWTVTTFMNQLDDTRTIDNAWLFGVRGSFRPTRNLEFGVSRTAQWCGDSRPCDLSTFGDLLVGDDNRGVNVAPDDEPGNQLGGIDIRWRLPRQIPAALYMQWIGEDGRGGGGAVGSWLRQLGAEYWGVIGDLSHRTHIELTDSMCKEGGFGFSDDKPNCAYEHSIYRTGYRYEGRAVGHFGDGDSRSYSLGSTLVQSAGHSWNATLRYMEINRQGAPNTRHTVSPTPQKRIDLQVSHNRVTRIGRLHVGLGYQYLDDQAPGRSLSDITGFLQWSTR